MSSSLIDWPLFGSVYSTPQMRNVFNQHSTMERWLEVEKFIANAQAALKLIPQASADKIAEVAVLSNIDQELLIKDMEVVGRPIVGLVRQLRELVGEQHADKVHFGCSTQDILDTATVLQLRDGIQIIDHEIRAIENLLINLESRYGDVSVLGRTNGQWALPIKFGQKTQIWSKELQRRRASLDRCRVLACKIQLGGAVGDLQVMGTQIGYEVRKEAARQLDLEYTEDSWQNSRDGIVELLASLGVLCGALEKISKNINLLASDDINLLKEIFVEGAGASSSMAHKKNQRASEFGESVARLGRHRAAQSAELLLHEFERSAGVWVAEWATIPEVFLYTSGALYWLRTAISRIDEVSDREATPLSN